MSAQTKFKKGQAIVLIAIAIAALFGLVALGLDGGHVYSDRRQAQNAADAASLTVARRYAQDQTTTVTEWTTLAQTTAATNGYDNNVPTRSVVVLAYRQATAAECPDYVGPPPGLVFQVDIDSYLPTWFGPVIGVSQVHNHVVSFALSCPPQVTTAFGGNAVVVLHKTAPRALEFSGSSTTHVTSSTGQGLYIRSSAVDTNTQNAMYEAGGQVITPRVSVVGGIYGSDQIVIDPAPVAPLTRDDYIKTGAAPLDRLYHWPEVGEAGVCPAGTPAVTRTGTGGDTLTPGVYPGSPADYDGWNQNSNFPPNGVKHLSPGVYCLDNDFKTTSVDLDGTGVAIVQRNGVMTITGSGNVNLSAPTSGPLAGLLLYLPLSNPISNPNADPAVSSGINIQGGGSSSYDGSIVAPGAHVAVAGGSGTTAPLQTQLVGDTISIGGSGDIYLHYDATTLYLPPIDAFIRLLR